MRKNKVVQMAEEKGLSVPELIIQLHTIHQSKTAVAAHLGIGESRLYQLFKKHNLVTKTIVVQEK